MIEIEQQMKNDEIVKKKKPIIFLIKSYSMRTRLNVLDYVRANHSS